MKQYTLPFKTVSVLIIGLLTIAIFNSCDKDDSTNTNDSYYVRYSIVGNGAYGRFSNWTATTPDGLYSNNGIQITSWTQTYGPLNKGFNCKVQIGNYINGAPTIKISVAKNTEPFALKLVKTGNSASYLIN